MSIHQLVAASQTLREALTGSLPRAAAQMLLELMASCCALLVKLSVSLREIDDPRVAAAHARLVETIYRYTLREQLHSAIHLESTGAHMLEDEELVAVAESRSSFAVGARQHSGRAHYQNTGEFLATWLGLNSHEGQNRVRDAHLLIARRLMDGSTIAPRMNQLATLYTQAPALDPRLVARVARALDKFEPADTCFQGQPLEPTASNEQGQLLEHLAAELLQEPDRATRESKLAALLATQRKARKKTRNPEPGIYPRGTVGDCDKYELYVAGTQREEFRSTLAQADNPRTNAGKAARSGESSDGVDMDYGAEESGSQGEAQPGQNAGDPAVDELFSSKEPPPPWAREDRGTFFGQQSAEEPEAEQPAHGAGEANPSRNLDSSLLGDGEVPVAQRRLNALMAALRRRSTGKAANGITPKIGMLIQLSDLQDLREASKLRATTGHGLNLDSVDTAQLICQGEIYRVVFGPDGQPLDVGRKERFFTDAMKRAIFARDRGCIVPGCTAPPEMIEYHHDNWWERGGCTSVRNGSCLCRRHHHAIHAGLIGLVTVGGLAHIMLPKHLDPLQIPRRNSVPVAA
ncbi:MAG TPA: HNH endonuclease [Glutamicibacter sp.]|uniref:HNH endonuclease domain-containing protein n=1 Tax=Glutamicibacter arilaitensis (strain DSM 16368 / CIP 108037 / IAM 15318 / JCM 13566 / NCIMB 14258 / Re117) TaxID=861360 RepID=A0ABP1U4K6_GLUAR|nr:MULTISPECIES: HNH endonuclease signature motif containing protein [Glutamicibacter]CBT75727.1 HNH endonuclease domain-containing protein [Glutamicibacter arilaitensis Re117]HCH48733.1 HNH endonuclease [Glutamicibacter sp.]